VTPNIEGILPILHTPFDVNDEIDRDSLGREIDWAFEQGSSGVCSAMVSEILRLTSDERVELNRLIVEMTAGRGVVVASVGAESTRQAINYAKAAVDSGCSAIMAIPPVSTALPLRALQDYFSTLAETVPVPLIVQDASSYVGASIPTDFYVRLLDEYGPRKILFKPEGAPIGPNISDLRDASGGRACMFDGSGGILLIDAFRRGIVGTMPGIDLLDGIAALWKALKNNDDATAYRIYFPICALVALQLQAGLDGFLAIEKYILVKRGLFTTDRRREPNSWSLDPETQSEVDRLLALLTDALAAT
jgi:4-hydroxy-tetrahydrodipicolinate synthase